MANQAIALQARAPQGGGFGAALQQGAQMINMMAQQRAAERQAAQAQQRMDIDAAQEARAAAKAVPELQKAEAEAKAAQFKYVMDFFDTSRLAISKVRDPQHAQAVGNRLKELFPEPAFQQSIDETLASIPQNPAQFETWREDALFRTLEGKDQLARDFQRQTTGEEERIISMPKYGRGAAEEVPGSRLKVAEGFTYIKDENGNIFAMPKTAAGTGGFGAVGTGGADTVYGFGQFAQPPKPLTTMTIGEVQDFQKNSLIPATRGKIGAGPDKGTGAVGTYQIVYGTLQQYAPKVLGENWRSVPFTADVQDKIARAIYEDVKGGNLKDTWAGMPNNRPGEYANVPWEQVRGKIAQVESAGGAGGAPQPVIKGSGKGGGKSTESERRFGTISKQMITTLGELTDILRNNPDAVRPGGFEYVASKLPFVGDEARLWAQSEPRQQFEASILRFLDNITYVNTGAGVTVEQQNNYRKSYVPTIQDTPMSAHRKLSNMIAFAENVKDAAGVMWTPEMDKALSGLRKQVNALAPRRKDAAPAPKAKSAPKTQSKPKQRLRYNPATGELE